MTANILEASAWPPQSKSLTGVSAVPGYCLGTAGFAAAAMLCRLPLSRLDRDELRFPSPVWSNLAVFF